MDPYSLRALYGSDHAFDADRLDTTQFFCDPGRAGTVFSAVSSGIFDGV